MGKSEAREEMQPRWRPSTPRARQGRDGVQFRGDDLIKRRGKGPEVRAASKPQLPSSAYRLSQQPACLQPPEMPRSTDEVRTKNVPTTVRVEI
jgi:hypothetical protein